MGFLDKAKQAAEQAQKKLDETQENFNKKQAGGASSSAGQGASVQYDDHGRPIQQDAPATAPATPPAPAGSIAPEPPAPAAGGPEAVPPAAAPPPPAAAPEAGGDSEPQTDQPLKEGVNQNPDPFKPIQ